MPKIIANLRERILAEARRQIEEQGYGATTIRSIASACGVGTGTVYNYFESKDMLIASFMVDDWMRCLDRMKTFPSEIRVGIRRKIIARIRVRIWNPSTSASVQIMTLFHRRSDRSNDERSLLCFVWISTPHPRTLTRSVMISLLKIVG